MKTKKDRDVLRELTRRETYSGLHRLVTALRQGFFSDVMEMRERDYKRFSNDVFFYGMAGSGQVVLDRLADYCAARRDSVSFETARRDLFADVQEYCLQDPRDELAHYPAIMLDDIETVEDEAYAQELYKSRFLQEFRHLTRMLQTHLKESRSYLSRIPVVFMKVEEAIRALMFDEEADFDKVMPKRKVAREENLFLNASLWLREKAKACDLQREFARSVLKRGETLLPEMLTPYAVSLAMETYAQEVADLLQRTVVNGDCARYTVKAGFKAAASWKLDPENPDEVIVIDAASALQEAVMEYAEFMASEKAQKPDAGVVADEQVDTFALQKTLLDLMAAFRPDNDAALQEALLERVPETMWPEGVVRAPSAPVARM